jgi:tetratricopeptide (TPR) repeat protein
MVRLVVLNTFLVITLIGCSSRDVILENTRSLPYSNIELKKKDIVEIRSDIIKPIEYDFHMQNNDFSDVVASLFEKSEPYRLAQKWSLAMNYLEKARQIEPRNPHILYRQAWIKKQEGHYYEAKQLLNRASLYDVNGEIVAQIQFLTNQLSH